MSALPTTTTSTLVIPATAPAGVDDATVRSHTVTECRLERLFTRGQEFAGTLIRPEVDTEKMGVVASTEAHKRHILAMVPDWLGMPVVLELAFGALAVCHLRASDYTPVEEMNILYALGRNSHMRAHIGVLFTNLGCSWRTTFEGIFSSSALRRVKAKMIALEGFSANWEAPRCAAVISSCGVWLLSGCPA